MLKAAKFVILLASCIFIIPATAGALDRVDTPQQLLPEIEAYIAEVKKQGKKIDPLFESSVHLVLARTYAHFGEYEKTNEHLGQVKEVEDARIVVRPFLDAIMTEARRGHIDNVVKRIQAAPALTKLMGEPRKLTYASGQRINPRTLYWTDMTFCGVAAKKFASKQNYEGLDKIEPLPECQKIDEVTVAQYRVAALVTADRLVEAYEKVRSDQNSQDLAAEIFEACLPQTPNPTQVSSLIDKIKTDAGADVMMRLNIANMLLVLGDFEGAWDVVRKIDDSEADAETPQQRYRAMNKLYNLRADLFEHFYQGHEDKLARDIAAEDGFFTDEPVLTGGFSSRDPVQWWVRTNGIATRISENPTDAGLEMAFDIKNDRARFALLKDVFLRLDKHKEVKKAGCDKTASECILDEMDRIVANEKDETARNVMYRLMASMAGLIKDEKRAAAYTAKQTPFKQMMCVYDMCGDKDMFKLRYVSQYPKGPDRFDKMMGSYSEELIVPPTADPKLADLAWRLQKIMVSNWPDYKTISDTSGYAVGYLNNQVMDHRGVYQYQCPLEPSAKFVGLLRH